MNKTLECKLCGALVHNCGPNAVSAICMYCINDAIDPPPTSAKKSVGYPRGWKFMTTFVHQNGTVYHKGVEQPNLKGTLKPTEIVVVTKKDKLEKKKKKEEALAQIGMLKKKLKNETKKGQLKKLQSQIKKLQRQL